MKSQDATKKKPLNLSVFGLKTKISQKKKAKKQSLKMAKKMKKQSQKKC